MTSATLHSINQSIDEQIARKAAPQGFPDLPDLPQAGSYFLLERLGRSIIISRGRDDVIRAFHKTCLHRGSAFLTEPSGKATHFVCPYHRWSYDLMGELVAVRSAHDFLCLDKSGRRLVPAKCEVFRRLIFVNLDPDASPISDYLASTVPHIEGFPFEGLVTKDAFSFEMDCNWKLAYHNFLEIYRVNTVHPVTLAPYFGSPSYLIARILGYSWTQNRIQED